MHFRTIQLIRELALAYLTLVGFLLLAYFLVGATTPFVPERYGLFHGFSRWPQLSGTLVPAVIILYGIMGWLTITALAKLGGRLPRRKDVFFYLISSAVFLLCYLILFVCVYLAIQPITAHMRATAITEIPLLTVYGTALLVIGIGWKFLTFVRLRTRIRYFRLSEPSLSPRSFIAGFRGPDTLFQFGYFLLVLFVIGILPIGLLLTGALLQHPLILAASIIVGLAVFSYGYFFLLVQIWNRTGIGKKKDKKAAPRPVEKKGKPKAPRPKQKPGNKRKGEDQLPPSEEND